MLLASGILLIEASREKKHLMDGIVLQGCISQYIRLLYWRDASLNTLDCCIRAMHPSIHYTVVFVLEGCISQYI